MSQYNISELGRPLCFPVDIFCRWCKLNFGSQHGSSELSYKTFEVYFRCCLIFFPTTTSSQLKNNNFQSQNLNHRDLFPYLNHILRSKFELLVKLNISQIPKKSIWWSKYFKKLDSSYCKFLNSKLLSQIFFCKYYKIFRTAAFKTIFILPMSKIRTHFEETSYFETCMCI